MLAALSLCAWWVRFPAARAGQVLAVIAAVAGPLSALLVLVNAGLVLATPRERGWRVVTVLVALALLVPWVAWVDLSGGDVVREVFRRSGP